MWSCRSPDSSWQLWRAQAEQEKGNPWLKLLLCRSLEGEKLWHHRTLKAAAPDFSLRPPASRHTNPRFFGGVTGSGSGETIREVLRKGDRRGDAEVWSPPALQQLQGCPDALLQRLCSSDCSTTAPAPGHPNPHLLRKPAAQRMQNQSSRQSHFDGFKFWVWGVFYCFLFVCFTKRQVKKNTLLIQPPLYWSQREFKRQK